MQKIELKSFKLSEFCLSVFDGTHDSPKYLESGYHLVTSKHLGQIINIQNAPYISKDDFDKINVRSKVEKNDVLISLIGSVGIVSFVKNEPNFVIKNIGVIRAKSLLDSKYLYFYFQSNKAQNDIKEKLAGSTQPFLSLSSLRSFNISVSTNQYYLQHIVNTISFLLLKSL